MTGKFIAIVSLIVACCSAQAAPMTFGFKGYEYSPYTGLFHVDKTFSGTMTIDPSVKSEITPRGAQIIIKSGCLELVMDSPGCPEGSYYGPEKTPFISSFNITGSFGNYSIHPWTNGWYVETGGYQERYDEYPSYGFGYYEYMLRNRFYYYENSWSGKWGSIVEYVNILSAFSDPNRLKDIGNFNQLPDLSTSLYGASIEFSRYTEYCDGNKCTSIDGPPIHVYGTLTELFWLNSSGPAEVPEPSTGSLIVMGAVALALRRRKFFSET